MFEILWLRGLQDRFNPSRVIRLSKQNSISAQKMATLESGLEKLKRAKEVEELG